MPPTTHNRSHTDPSRRDALHTDRPHRRPARSRGALGAITLCVVLSAAALGCSGDDGGAADDADQLSEQIAEAGGGDAQVDIDADSGQVDVSTPDGEVSVGATELPEDFPADIPFPGDYELTSVLTTTTEGNEGWTVSGTLADADEGSFDELVTLFTDDGWTNQSDASGATGGGFAATALLDDGTWSVLVSVQVGVQGQPDSFSYVVTPAA